MKFAVAALLVVAGAVRIVPLAADARVAVPSLKATMRGARPDVAVADLERRVRTAPPADREIRTDQLLTVAAERMAPGQCTDADEALRFAHSCGHRSAIGYCRLGDAYVALAAACDPLHEKATVAYRSAGRVPRGEYTQFTTRARASFLLGQLVVKSDPAEARRAYAAAMAVDPNDRSGGYAWMSAISLAEMARLDGNIGEARRLLRVAAAMPDRYGRAAESRRRDAALGNR